MTYSLAFEPLLPWQLLAVAALLLALVSIWMLFKRSRGSLLRALAAGALLAAIANPSLQSELRAPLKSTVAIIVDESQSQQYGDRKAQTDQAVELLKGKIARFDEFDVRVVPSSKADGNGPQRSTRVFSTLNEAFQDVPAARIAGAIVLTDGQVHDVPQSPEKALGFNAPVHVLLTGKPDEFDRVVTFIEAPKFGITGKPLRFVFRVNDDGLATAGAPVAVRVLLNGELVDELTVPTGQNTDLDVEIKRAGNNIIQLIADPLQGEVSSTNNVAVAAVDGIRENLRVLLVSGEPHAGERTWRNLLKSDASVDLIHFTILRPPEKQDGTPINELSLIAFPTQELFDEKINEFDLVIFDRYQHRNILPFQYYDNIAQYVENGGALLLAAGPEYAGELSIANTPLAAALPALPTGGVEEVAFFPRLTETGKRHPVTRGLEGSNVEPPKWSRWFRLIDVDSPEGNVIMKGPSDKPLLVLNRKGKGRAAALLSDQGWLWARGFEGGGPHVSLYRRTAHWLMAEPELEEEALNASSSGSVLEITRQTMGDTVPEATVTSPTGTTSTVKLAPSEPGLFRGKLQTDQIGLFQVSNGDLTTLAHVGPLDAPEFKSIISTPSLMQPVATATKAAVRRLSDASGNVSVPDIVPVSQTGDASGTTWLGLRRTNETELLGISRLPLFSGLLGLALLLAAIASMWWREGR
ncbi:MAG: hypothetical protein ACRCU5_16845 [Rhizobiaceae bacterium]